MEPKNFIHKHPLHFSEEWSNVHGKTRGVNCSSGCGQPISTQFYACIDCKFFLHKSCSELPLNITHPFHDKHPLILLSDSPYKSKPVLCDFCGSSVDGFVYHCPSCRFNLHIKCALLPEFLNGDFPQVDHHIHVEHPLFFIKNLSHEVKLASSCYCSVCFEQLSSDSSFYTCLVCKLFLHKSCSETELPLNINHPFHEKQTLTLLKSYCSCQFCHNDHYRIGLCYRCPSCPFNLHIKCALLPEFLNRDFPKVDHHIHVEHPLFFIKNLSHDVKLASSCYCSVCLEQLSLDSSFYTCVVCKLFLHKSCSETELQLNINHPFHEKHTLTLTLLKSNSSCQFCHNNRYPAGLFYHCPSCSFKLHIKCALLPEFLNRDFPKVDHHIHVEHPLFFIKNLSHEVKLASSCYCSVCSEQLSNASFYTCVVCNLFLHKSCSETELPLNINHPFHEKHTLTLTLLKSYSSCQFCHNLLYHVGLFYHCSSCRFKLHIKCAFLSQFLTGNFPKRDHHFSDVDEHPLFFIQKYLISSNKLYSKCFVCAESLCGSSFYYCSECQFFLHKSCVFEELPLKINHSFHDKHAITLTKKGNNKIACNFCLNVTNGFMYNCRFCKVYLDTQCALLITKDPPKRDHHFSHVEHPLVFVKMLSDKAEIRSSCSVCSKPLLGTSFYSCPDCQFFFHKECEAELSTKIMHFAHPQHPLIPRFSPRSSCPCHFCHRLIDRKEIGYECPSCDFYIHRKCILPRFVPESKIHDRDHQLIPFRRKNLFICDACGGSGNSAGYLCGKCNLMVHWDCILLPKTIKFKLHSHHRLVHNYWLPEKEGEKWTCQFCFKKVEAEYGSYKCLHLDCNYVLHASCVKKNEGLYIEVESENEESDDEASSSSSCAVVLGDKIKHISHEHELVLDKEKIIMNGDKKCCDGCALPILIAAYSCSQAECNFSLHKACAQIGEHKPHWAFRDPLRVRMESWFRCRFCEYYCSGFRSDWEGDDDGFRGEICLRCSEIPFITTHEAHAQHSLFCDQDHRGPCSGCGEEMGNYGGYKCTLAEEEENCKSFALDYRCLTRPLEVQHRFHHHLLKLTYEDPYKDKDDGDPFQHMCEICEDRRNPKLWFYRCDECDFDAHPDCVLGEYPFIKRGSISGFECHFHYRRLLHFQSEKYPYPECDKCGYPCKDDLRATLKCPRSECNFALHFKCQYDLRDEYFGKILRRLRQYGRD